MKLLLSGLLLHLNSRAPQGARGLKFKVLVIIDKSIAVAPRKGRVG